MAAGRGRCEGSGQLGFYSSQAWVPSRGEARCSSAVDAPWRASGCRGSGIF